MTDRYSNQYLMLDIFSDGGLLEYMKGGRECWSHCEGYSYAVGGLAIVHSVPCRRPKATMRTHMSLDEGTKLFLSSLVHILGLAEA